MANLLHNAQRMFDLVRYQRAELHEAGLVTDEEYAMLCEEGSVGSMRGSRERLEGYDSLQTKLKESEAALAALQQADPLAAVLQFIEQNRLYINRSGYRGRGCWEITVADPGGHYLEERMRVVANGITLVEAWQDLVKNYEQKGYTIPTTPLLAFIEACQEASSVINWLTTQNLLPSADGTPADHICSGILIKLDTTLRTVGVKTTK